MNTAYLLLGGNLGDKEQNLRLASEQIERLAGPIAKRSGIFITKAWGKENQPDFYNLALCVKTRMNASDLLKCLLEIEASLGRIRNEKWEERLIDIDIVFYNEEVIDTPGLKIPHPHLQDRKFVLVPLAEIAAHYLHPVFHKTVEMLLQECEDRLDVKPLQIPNT